MAPDGPFIHAEPRSGEGLTSNVRRRRGRVKMGDMATVYASGSRPQACRYGHPWTPGSGNMILSWVLCECDGAKTNPSGYGHHRIRCIAPGCPSVWNDPPCTVLPRNVSTGY